LVCFWRRAGSSDRTAISIRRTIYQEKDKCLLEYPLLPTARRTAISITMMGLFLEQTGI
jgi:hypothetical protein